MKFRLKMMEAVDEKTMEWAQKASKAFAKLSAELDIRMDDLRKSTEAHNSREEQP